MNGDRYDRILAAAIVAALVSWALVSLLRCGYTAGQ